MTTPAPVRARRPVVGTRSPVHGLARRSLPFTDVVAQSLSAVAPSAAATTMPLLVATVAGGSTVLALAVALVLAVAVAACVNQFTRRIAATGSLYTFVVRGLGPRAGVVTGVAMLLGYGFITMFALAGGGWYAHILVVRFFPALAPGAAPALVVVLLMGAAVWWVLLRGIRRSARVTLVIEVVSVVLLAVLVLAMLAHTGPTAAVRAALPEPGTGPADVAVGTAIALTAFVGFESAATLGAEARRPFRAVPRAVTWTALGSGLLYLGASVSQLVGYAGLGLDLAGARSPANELAVAYGVSWAGPVLDVGITASFFACAIASSTALVRVLFTMGREGLAPRAFGIAHAVHGTPARALALTMPVVTLGPVAMVLLGTDLWSAMQAILVVAAGGYITAYALVCAAVPAFLRRIGEATWPPVALAAGTATLLAGSLVVMLVVQSGTPRQAGVWVFVTLLAVGVAAGLVRLGRLPRLWARLGVHDEAVVTDLLGAE
ncbi:APC family permease [Antribacter sp. KLBMP9083]|uniref:APC family permease n=1 Tax=Antribacter soli TaxID=2910976 RepID=A0AA41QD98_9MICO|nr:APC family permease [Antribacter soli]MCF4121027.1 APC family permease [Antribacter soli]